MDPQSKTYNMVSAATSFKNYDFDFGNLTSSSGPGAAAKGGAGGGSLKQQKLGGTSPSPMNSGAPKAPSLAPNPVAPGFRPMAAPWEAAAEKLKSPGMESVSMAPSASVQAAFKDKTAGTAGIGSQATAGTSSPSWMSGYMSSSQPGTAVGNKPDPLAGLWNSAAATSASPSAKAAGLAATTSSAGKAAPAAAGADPFDFFSGAGMQSLSSMKSTKSSGSASGGGNGSTDPFSMASMKASVPASTGVPNASAKVEHSFGADPFAQFSQPTPAAASFPSPSPAAAAPPASADPFAAFSMPSTSTSSTPMKSAPSVGSGDPFASVDSEPFGGFASASPAPKSGGASSFAASFPDSPATSAPPPPPTSSSSDGFDAFFGAPPAASAQPRSSGDPLEDLLFKPSAAASASASASGSAAGGSAFAADDWGAAFGAAAVMGDDGGGTVELEGLPPPPSGLTAAAATEKGEGYYKAGQFADAIKWLLWAEALIRSGGGGDEMMAKVFSTRAGCYKEAGEMKKAVADCSTVLELDSKNASVLMQRAVLYESMEKYKKGVEDLREVLKLDPGNRPAMNMLNRLSKMV